MSVARSRAWLGFGATAAVLLAVVSWLTVVLLQLDHDELHARRQAAMHERLRLCLWRMDSWLAPQLAREAMRPASDYRAFPAAPAAWTRGLARIAPDEVVVKSPLLGVESALFPLFFELGADGPTSPQVPLGNERDVCEADGIDRDVLDRAAARLAAFAPRLAADVLRRKVGGAEVQFGLMGCNLVTPEQSQQEQQGVHEYSNRQRNVQWNVSNAFDNNKLPVAPSDGVAAQADAATAGIGAVGPLLPVWLDGSGTSPEPLLVFARRVRDAAGDRLQGVVVDWAQLQRELLALVGDLFPTGSTRLVRCEQPSSAEQPSMLASVPARFEGCHDEALQSGLPMGAILWTTWGVTLLGLAVLGFTLNRAIGYGERRARFASAVTHELRTPLTTFRMYSEMLADGVVKEPEAQRDYLLTLQRESDRLARVVENVLAWSRLEDGRFTARRERHPVAPLLERIAPPLQRRLADAGMVLDVQIAGDARDAVVATDEDAVAQILFNLVDNAAKYARGAAEARVELQVAADADRVHIAVHDHGPGVPAQHRQRIFAPFDRGALPASSNDLPGVGLGLALARGLARDLGGELRLDGAVGDGARFVLELPRA